MHTCMYTPTPTPHTCTFQLIGLVDEGNEKDSQIAEVRARNEFPCRKQYSVSLDIVVTFLVVTVCGGSVLSQGNANSR